MNENIDKKQGYNFTCPHCQQTTHIDELGEYPYSWQLIKCSHCGKYFVPKIKDS